MKNQGKLVLFCRGKRIWRHLLKNISRWSRAGEASQTDDGAYFRQEALSSATTARFFARKHYRRRRRCVFSSGSTIVGDDGAFFRQEALSSATTMHFFARKQKLHCNRSIFSSGSRNCNATTSSRRKEAPDARPVYPPQKKNLPSIKKTFEFFLLIQKKKCNFALNETKKYNNNH